MLASKMKLKRAAFIIAFFFILPVWMGNIQVLNARQNKSVKRALNSSKSNKKISKPALVMDDEEEAVALNIYGPSTSHEAIKAAAKAFTEETGIPVITISGPQSIWQNAAATKGDLIYTISDDATQKFFEDRPQRFRLNDVVSIAFMDAILIVRKGNPKNIKGIDTLIRKELPLLVSRRASIDRDFHRKTWERLRVIYAPNALKANERFVTDINVPVWIVWQDILTNSPDLGQRVVIESRYRTTRSFNLIIPRNIKDEAQEFIDFLTGERGQEFFEEHGWYFR
ncbi:MAG: substrate-binding domain-containing protein [Spirochaetia bacterium]